MSWGLSKGAGKYGPMSGKVSSGKDWRDTKNDRTRGSSRPGKGGTKDPKGPKGGR